MSTVHEVADRPDERHVFTKGAPDVLLARCTHERCGGEVVALTDMRRRAIGAAVERLAADAMRTLAVGERRVGADDGVGEHLERDLVFLGVVGMIDPPREEASAAVAQAQGAGVRMVMITGDHPVTARAIAQEVGIAAADDRVVTGIDLDRMDERELDGTVASASVYARVSPEHKLLIVRALQRGGEVVAMTGDGVNDAPALKIADIGVAMGITGTDVSKQASDMVLADDNLATIVAAIEEGRAIYANIRKAVRYLLSSNTGEVLTMLFGIVFAGALGLAGGETGIATPLLAVQILWINLLTDAAPALAVGVDPPDAAVMRSAPRRRSARVIDGPMWLGIGVNGFAMAVATLFVRDLVLPGGLVEGTGSQTLAHTMSFTVLVLAQLVNVFNARSDRTSAFRRPFSNPLLWSAVALSAALQVAVVYVPFLRPRSGRSRSPRRSGASRSSRRASSCGCRRRGSSSAGCSDPRASGVPLGGATGGRADVEEDREPEPQEVERGHASRRDQHPHDRRDRQEDDTEQWPDPGAVERGVPPHGFDDPVQDRGQPRREPGEQDQQTPHGDLPPRGVCLGVRTGG